MTKKTDCINNWFRYYNPKTAQYLQSDPLGLQECNNLQKEIKDLQSGKDVTVNYFKKVDRVLYGAFPKTRKVRGAGIKSPIKTSSQKKQFKLQPYEKGNTAIYHKDYKFNQDRTTLIGHEGLPNGHPHKTIPHINVLTPTGKKATIYIKGDWYGWFVKLYRKKIEKEKNKNTKNKLFLIKNVIETVSNSEDNFELIKFIEQNTGYSEYRVINDCESDDKEFWIEYDPEVRILPGDFLIKRL